MVCSWLFAGFAQWSVFQLKRARSLVCLATRCETSASPRFQPASYSSTTSLAATSVSLHSERARSKSKLTSPKPLRRALQIHNRNLHPRRRQSLDNLTPNPPTAPRNNTDLIRIIPLSALIAQLPLVQRPLVEDGVDAACEAQGEEPFQGRDKGAGFGLEVEGEGGEGAQDPRAEVGGAACEDVEEGAG